MGRREDDRAFANAFAQKLVPFYAQAKRSREVYKLAARLGITSAGLGKYMSSKKKPVPKLRMVVFARKNLGVAIPYGSVESGEYLSSGHPIPVRIEVGSSEARVDFSGAKKLPGRVELIVDLVGSRVTAG